MPTSKTASKKVSGDVKNFERLLKCKTLDEKGKPYNNKGAVEYDKASLTEYLNLTVPEWRNMQEGGRLYSHLQHMLENTEGIRRFEIELLWKRSSYMFGLIVIFFTAFGVISLGDSATIAGLPRGLIVPTLALINAMLSVFFLSVGYESFRLQKHWEHHADYLHELLDTRLMRAFFDKESGNISTSKVNILVSIFIAMIWTIIYGALFFVDDSEAITLWNFTMSYWYLSLLVIIPFIFIFGIAVKLFKLNSHPASLGPIYFKSPKKRKKAKIKN